PGTAIRRGAPLFPRIPMPKEESDVASDDAVTPAAAGSGAPAPTPAEKDPGAAAPRPVEKAPAAEAQQPAPAPEGVALIDYEDFARVQLRVARVLHAERVPNTDKLLRLELEVGNERRQIVSGIAQHYQPEELVGQLIVLVANLKPRKIRGIESHGMLLAASTPEGQLSLVTVDRPIASGAQVK
ncbi:MAG: methionine--tRNA ligase subunit beta, partial [Bacillota bacterium]